MPAFFDTTCSKCRRRYGWQGEVRDKPKCPHCGHVAQPHPDDVKAMEELEELLRQKMLKDDDER